MCPEDDDEISEADADAAIGFTERRRALRAELKALFCTRPISNQTEKDEPPCEPI
jgi:hypothetical protein